MTNWRTGKIKVGDLVVIATAGEDKLAEITQGGGDDGTDWIRVFVFDWEKHIDMHIMHVRSNFDGDVVIHRLKGGR